MNIKIKITNAITGEIITDNVVYIKDYNFDTASDNHAYMSKVFADCTVNFFMDNGDFICSMPHNQKLDDQAYDLGIITWEDYCNKWYRGDLKGPNDDLDIIERMETEDFASRDSICY